MIDSFTEGRHIRRVTNFEDLISAAYQGEVNAIRWSRELVGNFSEIVDKIETEESITVVEPEDLLALDLSEAGQLAREIILNDLALLKDHGASPVLNVVKKYDRDEEGTFFPTDVYSFHVDRSPIATDTFLCTYYGEPSEILPNTEAEKKVDIPEIRNALKKQYSGTEENFDSFLTEHFYDLHYQAKPGAHIIKLGLGEVWRLAVDHPGSNVPPCLHRAPEEKPGEYRLLLIC
ncbi:MAG: hypothetical protein JNL60_06695 [Bacteroidia bacterium]|nr:hypothetical protein [Bacteroidia bacterium]